MNEPDQTISEFTRRAIIDYLSIAKQWSGALDEEEFLSRLYDLSKLPSTDHRFQDAAGDIWQHRTRNNDWPQAWVFTDTRFNLLHGPDEPFLRFLAETLDPIVRPNTDEAWAMVREYNSHLGIDGWELYVVKEISRRPFFGYRLIADGALPKLEQARAVAERLSGQYVSQQIRRLEDAIDKDPELAIGTAKEFIETLCKTILSERGVSFAKNEDLPALVKMTIKTVKVIPDNLVSSVGTGKTITVLLNNLGSIGHQLAELRNLYGTGHGKLTHHVGLEKRHARLAVGAATTLALFLYDSHEVEKTGHP